jgi:hypothetical protein
MRKKSNPILQYAVCIDNDGYKASLEFGKLYQIVPDDDAAAHGLIAVIDESGEAYAFSANRFFPVEVPAKLARALSPSV